MVTEISPRTRWRLAGLLAVSLSLVACGAGGPGEDADASGADASGPDARIIDAAPPPPPFSYAKTAIGNPTWDVVDGAQFTGPVGTMQDGYQAFLPTMQMVAPHHRLDMQAHIFNSFEPHPPPYDRELTTNLEASELVRGSRYAVADWVPPRGLIVGIVLAAKPGSAQGKTPDGLLPMMANAIFPISIDADLFRNGALIDADFDSSYPAVTAADPTLGGYSHVILGFIETTEYLPGNQRTGAFSWRFHFRDHTGAGYDLTAGPLDVQ
jgi:hypothetical protein